MTTMAGRPATTHVELIDVTNGTGRHVRAWHSPTRWAQVAAAHVARSDIPGTADHGQPPTRVAIHALLREAGVLGAPDAGGLPRILVLGTGPLAARVARHVLPLGGELLLSTLGTPAPGADADAARTRARPQPRLWQAQLVSSSPDRRAALVRGDPLDRLDPGTLVVVAADTVEPDRGLVARLVRNGVDHVVLGAHHDRAWVGPFWSRDAAGCLACQDHWLAELDPDYPAVLAELCRRPACPDDAMALWAASTLAAHLSRPGLGRSSLGARIEVFDRAEPWLHEVAVRPHPRCPCRRRPSAGPG